MSLGNNITIARTYVDSSRCKVCMSLVKSIKTDECVNCHPLKRINYPIDRNLVKVKKGLQDFKDEQEDKQINDDQSHLDINEV